VNPGPGSAPQYLEAHRELLRSLFETLGETFLEDDDDLIRWMEARWLGAEHGPGQGKPTYTERQVNALWPLLEELGLLSEVRPARREYDEVLVFGAAAIGLYRRLGLVRDTAVSAPLLSVLAGQRPHQLHDRDGSVQEYVDASGRFAAAEGWSPSADLVAAAQDLLDAGCSGLDAAAELFPSETDIARALMQKHWPSLRSTSIDKPNASQDVTNVLGERTFVWEHFSHEGPIPRMRLLNAAPVVRSGGPARPTSRSSLREWLASLDTPPQSLLAVVNQPHLGRVSLDIRSEINSYGMSVPRIEVVGRDVLQESVDVNLILGEIPARINAERQEA
jgi:hypothetical protein